MTETIALTIDDIERAVRQRLRFEAGRAKINAKRSAALRASTDAIRAALDRDLLAERPPRGRAKRIARALHMPRSTTARILADLLKCSH
jgi:AraC-like DNA-binding protein